jgi:hypothetical protein
LLKELDLSGENYQVMQDLNQQFRMRQKMHQANAMFDKKLSLYQYRITSALRVKEKAKFDEKVTK